MPMKWTYKFFMNSKFKIQANCNDHVKFYRDIRIDQEALQNWAWKMIFSRFLRSMGAAPQNWLIPQKLQKKPKL